MWGARIGKLVCKDSNDGYVGHIYTEMNGAINPLSGRHRFFEIKKSRSLGIGPLVIAFYW